MVKHLLDNLRFGSSLEIFYTIARPSSTEKLWWPCCVEKLTFTQDKRGSALTASVRFEARHGFRSSVEQFVFQDEKHLMDKTGTEYCWRIRETRDDVDVDVIASSSSGISHSTDDGSSYAPESTVAAKKRKLQTEREVITGPSSSTLRDCRAMYRLERRFDGLVQKLRYQDGRLNDMERHYGTCGSIAHASGILPLHFLRHKLRAFLEKVPSIPTKITYTDRRHGYSIYGQESFRKSLDCTLLQFDEIMEHVRERCGSGAHFYPPFEDLKSPQHSDIHISFSGFEDIMNVFTHTHSSGSNGYLVTKKTDRSSSKLLGLRVLGCVSQSSTALDAPMHITVGTSLSANFNDDKHITVLTRSNTEWNHIEDKFSHPLRVDSVRRETVLEHLNHHSNDDDLTSLQSRFCFSLRWSNDSDYVLGGPLAAQPDPRFILGSLEIGIPYVIVRDSPHSMEAYSLLR